MLFNSITYILFLLVVFFVFYWTNARYKWIVLLVASFLFYAALREPHLILTIIYIIAIAYCGGILIDAAQSERRKQVFLWSGICLVLLPLILLKYSIVLSACIRQFFGDFDLFFRGFSSIGVSFYTFQAISYLIDTYLGITRSEKKLGHFALYIAFFPKALQGPIERADVLLPQLQRFTDFKYDNIRFGSILFAAGLFKKVVIAAKIDPMVSTVYQNVHHYDGVSLTVATFFYAVQIYCDFSGYTDMALGSALFFNIKLTDNFKHPYAATSIADFWRRWHITFSRWLMDYLFKPLQMTFRRAGSFSTVMALIVTFAICGMWHGASWTFVLWGMINGLYMACSVLTQKPRTQIQKFFKLNRRPRLMQTTRTLLTFILICFAWIFFRANTTSDAFYIVTHLPQFHLPPLHSAEIKAFVISKIMLYSTSRFLMAGFLTALVFIFHYFIDKYKVINWIIERPLAVRWTVYYLIVMSILILGEFSASNQFIYFNF